MIHSVKYEISSSINQLHEQQKIDSDIQSKLIREHIITEVEKS